LSIHLRLSLPSDLFPSGFPTNILYAFIFYPIRDTCPSDLILDLIIWNTQNYVPYISIFRDVRDSTVNLRACRITNSLSVVLLCQL
jgi:hypothetical protein